MMNAQAVVRSWLFQLAFWGWSAVLAIILLPFAAFVSPRRLRDCAAFWMRGSQTLLKAIVGLDYRIEGREHLSSRPVLIASKHQAAWETLIFHTIEPDLVVALKHELTRIPIFGWYLMLARNIRIDRTGGAKALRSLVADARHAVDGGSSVLVFPEGTRTAVGAPPDYKPGVAALYKALDVPCVPVALNSGQYWGRGPGGKVRGTITLQFLEPIPPGLNRTEFIRQLQERIETATDALTVAG